MNIWILNHYATPPDTPGGTRHFDFARELVKRGNLVTIFAAGFSHRTRREERLEGKKKYLRENIDVVEFIWFKTFPYQENDWRRVVNMLSYSFRVILSGLRLAESPDVILASSPHLFTGLAGYILARFKKARFIFEVRDLWPQVFVEIGSYRNRNPIVKILRVLEKFLYQRAKKVFVLLPMASEYITGLGIPNDKIVYIPNGVSPEIFSNTHAYLPHELDELISGLQASGKTLVGYTGAHGTNNTLDTLLEAAKLLQDTGVDKIRFLLIGDGPEKQRLMGKAESWGLINTIFWGPIPKHAIPALLRAIDIAVLPRRRSGLAKYGVSTNKLFDYMASARPVVWGTNSVNNPVAEANCGITVSPEDPEAMARAIIELCNMSQNERQEMGMRGYEYVMKYHSVPVLADRLLEVMQEAKQH